MNILITGGAGFIGGHTADALIAQGQNIRILDNLMAPVHQNQRAEYISPGAELMIGDVRSRSDWEQALNGIDVVFHFAAYQGYLSDFSTFFDVNTRGTALLYETAVAKGFPLQKVVLASSQAVYGEGCYESPTGEAVYPDSRSRGQLERGEWDIRLHGELLRLRKTDETRVNPHNPYAISKATQEMVALTLGKRYEIPTVCMRYSIVQGPRQSPHNPYSGICRIFSLAYEAGQQPVVFEDGRQLRDFVNIDDVVKANLVVLSRAEADYHCFNVGGGKGYTVLDFARLAADAFSQPYAPVVSGEYRFGDTRHIESDITALQRLGWKPIKGPDQSVASYRDWLREREMARPRLEQTYAHLRAEGVIGKAGIV